MMSFRIEAINSGSPVITGSSQQQVTAGSQNSALKFPESDLVFASSGQPLQFQRSRLDTPDIIFVIKPKSLIFFQPTGHTEGGSDIDRAIVIYIA